jgi:hypothetical protein
VRLFRVLTIAILAFTAVACGPLEFSSGVITNVNLTPQPESPEQTAERASKESADEAQKHMKMALSRPGASESVDEIDQAIKLQPDQPFYYATKAAIAVVRGDLDVQKESLGKAFGLSLNEGLGGADALDDTLGNYTSALVYVMESLPKGSELYRRANDALCREVPRIFSYPRASSTLIMAWRNVYRIWPRTTGDIGAGPFNINAPIEEAILRECP